MIIYTQDEIGGDVHTMPWKMNGLSFSSMKLFLTQTNLI